MESPELDMAALGAAFRRLREARGWTRYRLASRAGMSDVYLATIEDGGSKRIGVDVVVKLSHALGKPVDELLKDAGLVTSVRSAMPELEATYSALTPPDQYALLHIGRALREARERYGTEEGKGEAESLEADPLTSEEFEQGRRQGKLAADPIRDADRSESDEPA